MGQSRHPKRILIVEDDPAARELAVTLFEDTMPVVETENAEEALAYLREHAADVAMVFTDVRMPGRIDGIDLARAIRVRWPAIKVVLTSGYIQWPNSDVPAGVEFMPKPWRAPDVLRVAENAARSA